MPLHQWHRLCCTCSLAVCVATRGCEHLAQVFARKLRPKPDLLSHGQSAFATISNDNSGIFNGISASNKHLKIQKLSKKLAIRLVRITCLLVLFMFGWIPLGSETRSVNSQPLWPSKVHRWFDRSKKVATHLKESAGEKKPVGPSLKQADFGGVKHVFFSFGVVYFGCRYGVDGGTF